MSNEEELQNNFSLLPMVTWPGPSQCWLETLNTSKTKPVSIASGPTFDQIAWICTIPTSKSTGRLSIPLWLSVSHQNEHQVSLLPKHLLSPPRGIHVPPLPPELCFPALALTKRFFPPCLHTQRKIFSCGGKNEPHLNLWHPQEENWLSVTPVVCVSFFPFL